MTSIPASRRARAITFAPRSWPSRPGLATSTRILRLSVIYLEILSKPKSHHVDIGIRRAALSASLRSGLRNTSTCLHNEFFLRQLQAPPQIPRGKTAIGMPALGNLFDLLGRGQLALAIEPLNRHTHAKIAHGKHVRASQ